MKKLIVLVAAVFVCLIPVCITPAFSADWNFYGSARISTFYSKVDKDMFHGLADTQNFEQNLQGNSRIGAKVKVSDTLKGRFEYGSRDGVNIRHLYGEWNFGAGRLIVGQTYTPFLVVTDQIYNVSGLNRGDTNMAYFGTIYSGREPLIGLKIGGLYIAAVELEDDVYDTSGGGSLTEITLPELHARYTFRGKTWRAKILAGYSRFEVQNSGTAADVTSYLLGTAGQMKIGQAYITGGGWMGQNAGNLINQYTSLNPDMSGQNFARWDGTAVTDNDGYGFHVSAGFVFNEKVKMEAGYGYTRSELDTAGAREDDARVYYLNTTLTLAPGVFVVPEIGRLDLNGPSPGDMDCIYGGMKWQINF